jgi:hypothetical protein
VLSGPSNLFVILLLSAKMRNKAPEKYLGFSVTKQKYNILGPNAENPPRKRGFDVIFSTNARSAFP